MTPSNTSTSNDAPTVAQTAALLDSGRRTSEQLTETALARAATPRAAAVFNRLRSEQALLEARASDSARAAGFRPSVLAGIPVSVKDLFDIAGEATTSGSAALADDAPATLDAPVIRRLRLAGAVLLGRTNMTELAFSGLGLNPHFGTPVNPCDRDIDRIPGGSSSGAAVSVALGIVPAAVGSDTGGSVRIPAALCGLVGFKSTASRIPLDGVRALSPSLDSIGPIASSVACCAALDAILSGRRDAAPNPSAPAAYRIGVPRTLVWDGIDAAVGRAVEAAMGRLSAAGSTLVEFEAPEFTAIVAANSQGGLAAAESFSLFESLLEKSAARVDPRVRSRIERGRSMSAAQYLYVLNERNRLQRRFTERLREVDFWLMPTVPGVAPPIASLAGDEAYYAMNARMLRNTSLVNFLDGCAISLPCQESGALPVGLSLVGRTHQDLALLAAAARLEGVVRTN